MRINKYLSKLGLGSRREVDQRISYGEILINDKPAQLGYQLKAGDKIKINKQEYIYEEDFDSQIHKFYIALYKPKGIVSSMESNEGTGLKEYLKDNPELFLGDSSRYDFLIKQNLHHIGRLDKDSRGLLILSNDGELTQKLSHPKFEHQKEYLVTCKKELSTNFCKDFSSGLMIDVEDPSTRVSSKTKTKPCFCQQILAKQFRVILEQGYKRQIRKMTQALNNEVEDLLRIRISNLALGEYLDFASEEQKQNEDLIILSNLDQGQYIEIQYLSI